jgi:DNA-binding NarL/FixJ family response regulator
MRIFVAEDNVQFQKQFEMMARAITGRKPVFIASTEAAATSWLDVHSADWDLAVIDIFLTQGNGFNVLKRCAKRKSHQRAVVVSNYHSDLVREQAFKAGADAYFDKLTELPDLMEYCQAAEDATRL